MALSVALTGGIASGKSTVADLFAARGAVLVDSDVLAREVVAPGTPGLAEIVARFGPEVLTRDGDLDRPALGAVIFGDEQARADLNAIIHPRVRARRAEIIASATAPVVISVIPLLVETNAQAGFDKVIVVDLPVDEQRRRLMERNDLTADQAQARIDAQASREQRLAVADWVVDNSGSRDQLDAQVDRIWAELTRR